MIQAHNPTLSSNGLNFNLTITGGVRINSNDGIGLDGNGDALTINGNSGNLPNPIGLVINDSDGGVQNGQIGGRVIFRSSDNSLRLSPQGVASIYTQYTGNSALAFLGFRILENATTDSLINALTLRHGGGAILNQYGLGRFTGSEAFLLGVEADGDIVEVTPSDLVTDEQIEDATGGMVSGNNENGITVTYDDAAGKLDFTVEDPSATNELGALFQQATAPSGKNGDLWRRSTDGNIYMANNGWALLYDNFQNGNWSRIGNDVASLNPGNILIQNGSKLGINNTSPSAFLDIKSAAGNFALVVRDEVSSIQKFNVLGSGEIQSSGAHRVAQSTNQYGNQNFLSSGFYDVSHSTLTWKDDRTFQYLHIPLAVAFVDKTYDLCIDLEGVMLTTSSNAVDRLSLQAFARIVFNAVAVQSTSNNYNDDHQVFFYLRQEGSLYRPIIRLSNTTLNIKETYVNITTRRGYIDTGVPTAPSLLEPIPSNTAILPNL